MIYFILSSIGGEQMMYLCFLLTSLSWPTSWEAARVSVFSFRRALGTHLSMIPQRLD